MKAAVDELPDGLFAGQGGLLAANRMVDGIEIANAGNAFGWSLQHRNTKSAGLGLQVFGRWCLARRQNTLLLGTIRDEELLPRLREVSGGEHPVLEEFLEKRTPIVLRDGLELAHQLEADLFEASRQNLIDASGTDWRRDISANSHRDDWRVKLAKITGRAVPAPGYVSEMQLGLSQEAIHAPPWLRNRLTVDALPLLVETINVANGVHPNSWALTGGKSRSVSVRLDVQGTSILEFHNKWVRLVIQKAWWDQHGEELGSGRVLGSIKSPPGCVRIGFDPDPEPVEFERVAAPLSQVATSLAEITATQTQRAHEHRSVLVDQLNAFLHEAVPQPGYVSDLARELRGDRRSVVPAAGANRSASSDEMQAAIEALPDRFASAGLTYSEAQIASFYTALQTKGFVIISGISGTGKSKIAQRFAEILPSTAGQNGDPAPATEGKEQDTDGYFKLAVRDYMGKFQRFHVPVDIGSNLPLPEPGIAFNVPLAVNGVRGEGRIRVRSSTKGVNLFPKGRTRPEFVALTRASDHFYLKFNLDEAGDLIEFVEIVSNLPSAADVVVSDQRWQSNHLFLPVRPDWRDGKPLIGYLNPLSGEYVRTDFLDFVLAASDDYTSGNRNAFFVILDEMNLAHVEYYFADVLSVIESGRDADGWTVEGIPLDVGEEDADLPDVLKLPPNLYIVGTVNMDETTHPFSPKVLDRAFTIELTEVDFTDYPPDPPVDKDIPEAEQQALLRAFTGDGQRYPRIDKGDIREVVTEHPQFRAELDRLNKSLRRSRMHFGYRTFDEIMQFVANAKENGMFEAEKDAFDHAVLMKVLPKFNGSRAKLENGLMELIHWCRTPESLGTTERSAYTSKFATLQEGGKSFDTVVIFGPDTVEDNWRYPATGGRAALMMQDLYTDGFASFG